MTRTVMAYIIMADIVMASAVMAQRQRLSGRHARGLAADARSIFGDFRGMPTANAEG